MTVDYKQTVFLPKTDFPMRGKLPQKEPELLAHWNRIDLFARQREVSAGREKFVLHDGPPYANGHLHIGHALNKILKDVVNRAQQMLGRDANYVPGWDCHGLPIEWKVEEQYRAAGKNKDDAPIVDFRRECREFAQHWIGVQSEEFQRLGVIGDWQRRYTTMSFAAEAQIAREIGKFAMNGTLYRGSKPVMWSVVERTALAEAEVEYQDHSSPSIFVRFPVMSFSQTLEDGEFDSLAKIQRGLAGRSSSARTEPKQDIAATDDLSLKLASVAIWTTTPWTIPGNRAIAYLDSQKEGEQYALYKVSVAPSGGAVSIGDKLVVAKSLLEKLEDATGGAQFELLRELAADELPEIKCAHPLRGQGYDFDVPLLPAHFVTLEQGTGFVHIAPSHGADDYMLGQAHHLELPSMVDEDGSYYDHVPVFAGARVLTDDGKPGDANKKVMQALTQAGALIASATLRHSYPHSWRSKKPVIFRNTPQWFIAMDQAMPGGAGEGDTLRQRALAAIAVTRFVPPSCKDRLRTMIAARPDWVISRQRAWGVPIAVFVHKDSGELLRDRAVLDRITAAFEAEGSDVWFTAPPERFLGNAYDPAYYEQVTDIVDVWFESGSTHSFVLEARADLGWPASLYLEGTDQHRGWFHSSLLESCGTRGRAPYDSVLTHGFVMDEQGRKMSKSLGNVTAPQEVVEKYGADILRLWVVGSDYVEDLRIGPEILKHQADLYRRIRNTLRYLLGSLNGFSGRELVPAAEMPELERWVLHRVWTIDALVRRSIDDYEFHTLWTALHQFCAVDLSAFYFDVRKDCLYCDALDSAKRRACRTVLDILFDSLTAWLAPILCFTAEEAWLARGGETSVHLRTFAEAEATWRDDALAAKWETVRRLRRVVTGALEMERAGKRIGSSLQAAPVVYADASTIAAMKGLDLTEIGITSAATLIEGPPPASAFTLDDVPGIGVVPALADGGKCERCWRVLPEVGAHIPADLCRRCADVVAATAAAD